MIFSSLENISVLLLLDLLVAFDVIDHQILLFVLYTTPLSDIAKHSVNHQLFVDDAQLQKSTPLSEVTNLTKEPDVCTDNIKTWMIENQLKFNDVKTEALLFPFSSSLRPSTVSLPDSITLGSHNIPLLRFCQEPWIHS